MTPVEIACAEFELHADALQRALGRGGALADMPRARVELNATEAALRALAAELAKEAAPS